MYYSVNSILRIPKIKEKKKALIKSGLTVFYLSVYSKFRL